MDPLSVQFVLLELRVILLVGPLDVFGFIVKLRNHSFLEHCNSKVAPFNWVVMALEIVIENSEFRQIKLVPVVIFGVSTQEKDGLVGENVLIFEGVSADKIMGAGEHVINLRIVFLHAEKGTGSHENFIGIWIFGLDLTDVKKVCTFFYFGNIQILAEDIDFIFIGKLKTGLTTVD